MKKEDLPPNTIIFENPSYETALIGISHDGRAIYDHHKMVEFLMAEGITEEEAVEFIDYNTIGALGGESYPIVAFLDE